MQLRLSPDLTKLIEQYLAGVVDGPYLHAMGFETANVHLGTPRAALPILRDLGKRPRPWLHDAATRMVKATTDDWQEWRAFKAKKTKMKASV